MNQQSHDTTVVLYVDDEKIEHEVMRRAFKEFNDDKIELISVLDVPSAIERIKDQSIDIVLLDNRLFPEADFTESAPKLRDVGFTGPIGIVSSFINDDIIQHFDDYGADFRLGKDEIDATSLRFILSEYSRNVLLPDACREDYRTAKV